MKPESPSLEELRRIAAEYHFDVLDEDLTFLQGMMESALESYALVDEMSSRQTVTAFDRHSYRPAAEENVLGAWYCKCSIAGEQGGLLTGKRIAIKDSVCVAGVPMMVGSAVLDGYIPDMDATIVTRIINAGGEIVGKAVCENLCASGSSFSAFTGPVLNPHDHARSAGGSSSGSAALVAAGEVDMAVGGDQGGSVRIPAAWCGVYGIKPTFGLVPYTGIFPGEFTLDHAGPIAGSVKDVAVLLEVMAGADGLDPRQGIVRTTSYVQDLDAGIAGVRVGVLQEGFGGPDSEPQVDKAVDEAAWSLEELGAAVSEVSIPMHRNAIHIFNSIVIEGSMATVIDGNAMGSNWRGRYATSLLNAFGSGRVSRPDGLGDNTKFFALLGRYMRDRYYGVYYAKAQNLAPVLKAAYDAALSVYDVLILPTTPMTATALPTAATSRREQFELHLNMNGNTAPFNVTRHPAMTVPCGYYEHRPIGMMIIGREWDDAIVLRVAHAYEQRFADGSKFGAKRSPHRPPLE